MLTATDAKKLTFTNQYHKLKQEVFVANKAINFASRRGESSITLSFELSEDAIQSLISSGFQVKSIQTLRFCATDTYKKIVSEISWRN